MPPTTTHAGRHLCIALPGVEVTAATRKLLRAIRPAGLVLFARNIESADQLRTLTRALKQELPEPPFIAIDQENGRVNRLRSIIGEIPTIAELKTGGDIGRARAFGQRTGQQLREMGVDMDFAPVLDLELFDAATDNALRDRCWGRTPAEVVRWAGAFLDGLQTAGVTGCPKHFPGLGASCQDSHEHLPTIFRSREELQAADLAPFRQLLPQLSAVMVGHGHYPALVGETPLPASLSDAIVTGLLRQEMKFDGLVLTDDMEMGAITRLGSWPQPVIEAVRAGADLALICHNTEKMLTAHEALTKVIESGRLSPRQRLR